MNRTIIQIAAAALLILGTIWYFSGEPSLSGVSPSTKFDIVEGKGIYADSCASCHGDKLQGQPDWQVSNAEGVFPAPPHDETGHTWHHTDELLFDYTKLGGSEVLKSQGITEFKSGMPGFGGSLSDADIRNVLAYIASNWPDRIKKMQAERNSEQ